TLVTAKPLRDRLLGVLGASEALGDHLARYPRDWRALVTYEAVDLHPGVAEFERGLAEAVDPDSLQPEFKVCAVSLRPVRSVDGASALHPLAAEVGLNSTHKPALSQDEKIYLAGFFTGLPDDPVGVPVLPETAPLRATVRLWVDGVLAGRYCRAGAQD
nr:hypothetical protein [Streptomyces sp. DSM 41633]